MIARLFALLPASLRRDLARISDRALKDAAEHCGSPRLGFHEDALLLFAPDRITSPRRALFGAPGDRRWLTRPADDMLPGVSSGFGLPGDVSTPPTNPGAKTLLYPFAMWDATALAANAQGVSGAPASYVNQSGYVFWVTHVSFAEADAAGSNFRLNPNYRVMVNPSSGIPWMQSNQKPDAVALLNAQSLAQIPNVPGFQQSRWGFASPFRVGRADGFYFAASSNNPAENTTASLALIGYKDNKQATPRVFWDTQVLIPGQAETPFQGNNFRADGDFDLWLTDLVLSGGWGGWGNAVLMPPQILGRPTREGPGFMPAALPATHMNNHPALLGPYWELRNPQPIYPGQVINVSMDNPTAAAITASVGFQGYLEIPAQ